MDCQSACMTMNNPRNVNIMTSSKVPAVDTRRPVKRFLRRPGNQACSRNIKDRPATQYAGLNMDSNCKAVLGCLAKLSATSGVFMY